VTVGNRTGKEGDSISIDGTSGRVYAEQLPTAPSEIVQALVHGDAEARQGRTYRNFARLMDWCAKVTRMDVRTNADSPEQTEHAITLGAQGLGLPRKEHKVFEGNGIDDTLIAVSTVDSTTMTLTNGKLSIKPGTGALVNDELHGISHVQLIGANLATLDATLGYGEIIDGALGWREGVLAFVGPRAQLPGDPPALAGQVTETTGWIPPGPADRPTPLGLPRAPPPSGCPPWGNRPGGIPGHMGSRHGRWVADGGAFGRRAAPRSFCPPPAPPLYCPARPRCAALRADRTSHRP